MPTTETKLEIFCRNINKMRELKPNALPYEIAEIQPGDMLNLKDYSDPLAKRYKWDDSISISKPIYQQVEEQRRELDAKADKLLKENHERLEAMQNAGYHS